MTKANTKRPRSEGSNEDKPAGKKTRSGRLIKKPLGYL